MSKDGDNPQTGRARVLQAPVPRVLLFMALPIALGMLANVSFNLADAYFVSRLGDAYLAAASFTFPVAITAASLAIGLGIGTTTLIAPVVGVGDRKRVQELTWSSALLCLGIGLVFTIAGLLTIEPLFLFLGAPRSMLPLIRAYMEVWYWGAPLAMFSMVASSAIRANGNAKSPGMISMGTALVNILLDPVLILGVGPIEGFGMAGAAYATLASRLISTVLLVQLLTRREQMLSRKLPALPDLLSAWREHGHISVPAIVTQAFNPITSILIVKLLASHGSDVVAGMGVAGRIEALGLVVNIAVTGAIGPILGQNWGAGQLDRVRQTIRTAYGFALAWGLVMCVACVLFGRGMAGFFSDSPTVIDTATLYFWVVGISFGLQGMGMVSTVTLNAFKHPLLSAGLNFVRQFLLYVPAAYLANQYWGVPGIFASLVLANLFGSSTGYLMVNRALNRLDEAALARATAPHAQPSPAE